MKRTSRAASSANGGGCRRTVEKYVRTTLDIRTPNAYIPPEALPGRCGLPDSTEPLAALATLERRYDGPIPEPLRQAARLGGAAALRRLEAVGQAAFFKAMVLGQLRAIRRRRADGSFYPALVADLALYRREWRRWRRLAARAASGDQLAV